MLDNFSNYKKINCDYALTCEDRLSFLQQKRFHAESHLRVRANGLARYFRKYSQKLNPKTKMCMIWLLLLVAIR